MKECVDGRWQVIIRGQTIDPLVRDFERLFNTRVLDTARREKKKDSNWKEREVEGQKEKLTAEEENEKVLMREQKGALERIRKL